MAIPKGGFKSAAAGVSYPGGAFSYLANIGFPLYFGGTFFIDTGYDDPVLWTEGVEAAEVYGARVYATLSSVSPAVAADTYLGKWSLIATPVWQSKHWALPTTNAFQPRILIQCDAYLSEPVSEAANSWQRVTEVDWSLYRL